MNPYDNRTPTTANNKRIIRGIIAQIRLNIAEGYHSSNKKAKTSFKFESFKVSCLDNLEAKEALINRLEKNMNKKIGTFQERQSSALTASPKKSILKEFLNDKEYDNAIEYALINDLVHLLPIEHRPINAA